MKIRNCTIILFFTHYILIVLSNTAPVKFSSVVITAHCRKLISLNNFSMHQLQYSNTLWRQRYLAAWRPISQYITLNCKPLNYTISCVTFVNDILFHFWLICSYFIHSVLIPSFINLDYQYWPRLHRLSLVPKLPLYNPYNTGTLTHLRT